MKKFLALSLSDVVFILPINAKMPTIVGILIFMSRINFVLSWPQGGGGGGGGGGHSLIVVSVMIMEKV